MIRATVYGRKHNKQIDNQTANPLGCEDNDHIRGDDLLLFGKPFSLAQNRNTTKTRVDSPRRGTFYTNSLLK